MDSNLFLQPGSSPSLTCKIHPVVIFTILDHYVRRQESQERVIGTLLGVETDGVIEIRNCFPVPHSELKVCTLRNKIIFYILKQNNTDLFSFRKYQS
jgi:hypothetical protein